MTTRTERPMTIELKSEDFRLFQQVSLELREIQERADHARQTYIAHRIDENLEIWVAALRQEKRAWDAYWKAHREYFPRLDD